MRLKKQIIEPISGRVFSYIFFRSRAEKQHAAYQHALRRKQCAGDLPVTDKQLLHRYGLRLSDSEAALLLAHARCEWANDFIDHYVRLTLQRVQERWLWLKSKLIKPNTVCQPAAIVLPVPVELNHGDSTYYQCPISNRWFARADKQAMYTRKILEKFVAEGLHAYTKTDLLSRLYAARYKPAGVKGIVDLNDKPIEVGTEVIDLASVDADTITKGKVLKIDKADDGTLILLVEIRVGITRREIKHFFPEQIARYFCDKPKDFYRRAANG